MARLRVGIILAIITGAVSLLSPGTGEAPPGPDYLPLPDPKTPHKPQGMTPSPPQGGPLLPTLTAPRSSLLPLASSNPVHLPQGAAFAPLALVVAAPVNAPLAPNVAAPVNAPSPTGAPNSASHQLHQHQAQLPPSGAMIPYLQPGAPLPYTPRANMYYLPPGASPFSPVPSPGRYPHTLPPGAASFLPPGAAPLVPPPGQQYPYLAPSNIPPQYGRSTPQTAGSPTLGQNSPVNNNPAPSAKGNLVLPLNWHLLNSPASQIQVQSAAVFRSNPPRPPVVLGRRNRLPFFSPNPTKPSSFMQILDFLGRMRATKELDCKTVPEALRMNLPKYYPLSCDYKCPPPTVCRNVGPVGFCCPPLVTDQLIWMVGLAERFKVLGG
ncbi:lysine-rich arabinogalactan protein 19-like [Haliotis rubra]|uniref:lysine-rich arabinogalactan protein 19-like n=1 Tax=Haliotis rubra TaxID=36100 RepID=UPI001EE5319A|nr:lysine-rich arabinogalactan protein 19-like [Haliotis rubra]